MKLDSTAPVLFICQHGVWLTTLRKKIYSSYLAQLSLNKELKTQSLAVQIPIQ